MTEKEPTTLLEVIKEHFNTLKQTHPQSPFIRSCAGTFSMLALKA